MNLYKNNRKKGYTLAEVLITVTILLILMAIAVPAIFSIRKNLRQKALDNKAELIYTAVQNNLVKLQNNGNSALYAKDRAEAKVDVIPSDADGEKILYYVTSKTKNDTDKATGILLTAGNVDEELYDHYWVVEYNPDSASVYAVFYSEKRDDYTPVKYNILRDKDERLDAGAEVGYYGGDMVEGSSTSVLVPKLTVTNEEKLMASISCLSPDNKPLSFVVTLEDAEKHKLTLKYKTNATRTSLVHDGDDLHSVATSGLDEKNEKGSIKGRQYNLEITLDDLSDAATRFAALYGEKNESLKKSGKKGLTAGTDLKITVEVKSENRKIEGKSTDAVTNSLFADKSTSGNAVIAYGRHLQNLDQASGVANTIKTAEQESDIHFEAQDDKEGISSWYSCYGEKTFKPVTNSNLISFKGNKTSTIYHLTVDRTVGKDSKLSPAGAEDPSDATDLAGLFTALPDNMVIESVYMSGTSVKGNSSANSYAGAFAGKTTGSATLTDCRVYLDSKDIEGKNEENAWISGAAVQGGLIGCVEKKNDTTVNINNCFAATVMDSGQNGIVGGLVGSNGNGGENINITSCYADSYLTGGVVGGLIGEGKNITIKSCYTAGYLKAETKAGGFIASSEKEGTTISHGYAAVTYLKSAADKVSVIYSIGQGNVGEKVFYLNKGNDDTKDLYQGEKVEYPELSNKTRMAEKLGEGFTASTTTYAYNLRNQGLTSYSYPSLSGMNHYGDWEANYEAGSLVYYERYEDGTVGFLGGNITSTLQENKVAVGDGYGVVYEESVSGIDPFDVEYQGTDDNGNTITQIYTVDTSDENVKFYEVTVSEKTYIVYPLPSEIVNAAPISNTYYQKLTIKGASATNSIETQDTNGSTDDSDTLAGKNFYFNPHFAKTVESTDTVPENPKVFTIRTARQLYHLSLYYQAYSFVITSESVFNQELDIDYSKYQWTDFAGVDEAVSVQEPLGVVNGKAVAFKSVYNGRYHEIRGISFETSSTAVGFIGENAGVLQNVFLVSDWSNAWDAANPYVNYKGDIKNNKTVYMGAMAGINNGRILNCAVCGYSMGTESVVYVQRNGYLYLGGFIGSNHGMIQNCETDAPVVNASVLFGTAYLGGFAGENSAGATIRSSYAVGDVSVEYARDATSVISGFAASNAGVLKTDYCAVALTAAGTTTSYGFAPKGAGSIRSDCYYLNGGTFRYLGREIAFDNDNKNGGGESLSYYEMKEKGNAAEKSVYCSETTDEGNYPFAAVVSKGKEKVHYGNWQIPVDLGAIGVIYWELEEGGSNNGYHFSYIGYKASGTEAQVAQINGSTLCKQHDDGGKVTQYGYGYYYEDTENNTDIPSCEAINFQTGDKNETASQALSDRLEGFTVIAFTTESSIKQNADPDKSYMKMKADDRTANGVWRFTYKEQRYTFTINPFFANAMQYGSDDGSAQAAGVTTMSLSVVDEDGFTADTEGVQAMPGTSGNEYEIRSDEQLQYINWNATTKNAYTALNADNYKSDVSGYTYLGYMYTGEYRWTAQRNPSLLEYTYTQNSWWSKYYTRTKNDHYWEFVEDNSGSSYTIDKWKENKDGTYSKNGTDSVKGYWIWKGTSDCPIPVWYENNQQKNESAGNYRVNVEGHGADYSWKQTHDVDAGMYHDGGVLFTQIGSIYDELGSKHQEEASAYISYFNGSYNGNTYSIKNVEIDSKSTLVGLFGALIGADVRNVILYSENGNYIQRNAASPRSWYALGGLCGLAATGTGENASDTKVSNCTVSGYTIRDNSTKSAWGDGNVGGMFGMCTIDLEKCTAVNTIDLNCEFAYGNMDGAKGDGVSVRTGGLVGSMRGKISNCYTGGRIVCEERILKNAYLHADGGAKIFLGGITGGIYIKNGGNLLNLLGTNIRGIEGWNDTNRTDTGGGGNSGQCTTPTTIISNCYTYIDMPSKDDTAYVEGNNSITYERCVKSIEPIGSNGETPYENDRNYHVRININNCFYYADETWKALPFTLTKTGYFSYQDWTNIDDTAVRISWEQLAGKKTIKVNGKEDTLLNLLNAYNPESYSMVTTKENGQIVDGKYSFPGNSTYLNGENYPFPAILTQTSLNGKTTARVHYGEWPLEGIYWEESRAVMDIYENLKLDTVVDSSNLVAEKDFYLLDKGGVLNTDLTLDNGFTVEYSTGEEDGDTEAQTFSSEIDTESEDGFSDGTGAGEEVIPGTRIENREDYIAEITKLAYNPDKGCFVATVKALKTGSTVIKVTATGTEGEAKYSAAFNLMVTADLNVYTIPSKITQNVNQISEVTLCAVPKNTPTSNNSLGFDDGESEVSFEAFEDADQGEATAYADEIPVNNLAAYMTWSVEVDEEEKGLVTIGDVENGKFTVRSDAKDSFATLTVTGKFTYQNIEYTNICWVEIVTKENGTVSWEKNSDGVALTASDNGGYNAVDKTYRLNIPSGVLKDDQLTANDIVITGINVADDGASIAEVKSVTPVSDGYEVVITCKIPGTVNVTVNVTDAERNLILPATFVITITDASTQSVVDTSDSTNGVNDEWVDENSDFTSDTISAGDNSSNNTIDMLPNQDSDIIYEDEGGWDSGDSNFQ